MSNPSVQMEPVLATNREALAIKHLAQVLGSETAQVKLLGRDGEEIVIPEPVYHILRQVIHLMASGQAVALVSLEHELTTQEAADLLNVSRPFLVKLLEQGEIPYIKVGAHRRIRVEDLMAYKQQRDAQRRQCLKEPHSVQPRRGILRAFCRRLKWLFSLSYSTPVSYTQCIYETLCFGWQR